MTDTTESLETDETDEKSGLVDRIKAGIPERPSTADHDSTLASVADELRDAVVNVTLSLTIATARIIPFSERFFRGLYQAGIKGIWKKSGCDYIGMIQVGGEIKPVPVDWDHEKGRFENRHGDWWKAPTEGEYQYRMAGKVPAIWASANSNDVGSHLQAEVAEALDLGNTRPLYESGQVEVQDVTLGPNGSSGPQAIADGGSNVYNVTAEQPGRFVDELAFLTSEADARVVSMEKYYETYPAVTDPEEMKNQEVRGELSASNRDYGKFALKMMLIAGGIIAVVQLGPPVLEMLMGAGGGGGGGGGGGSIIPIMLGLN